MLKFFKNIHFSFIFLFLWYLLTFNLKGFILFCLVVLTHEFGHYLVAKKLGYKLDNFIIAPYGVCLNYKEKAFAPKDEIFIACAGPFVNIGLSILVVTFWWIFPAFYNFSYEFVFQSLMLGLFNLLPCYPLDGGRIMVGALSNKMARTKTIKFITILNIIFAIILLLAFIVTCFINFNPSLCLCSIFMLSGIIDIKNECKYAPLSIYKKKTKNFSKPLILSVNASATLSSLIKHIELNRYTLFMVIFEDGKSKLLDEQTVKFLSLSYPLSSTLTQIFKRDKG